MPRAASAKREAFDHPCGKILAKDLTQNGRVFKRDRKPKSFHEISFNCDEIFRETFAFDHALFEEFDWIKLIRLACRAMEVKNSLFDPAKYFAEGFDKLDELRSVCFQLS